MTFLRRTAAALAILMLAAALAGAGRAPETRVVVRVVDGDTLELDNGDKVRLIGVDTPETVHPRRPVERYGKEASAFTRRLLEGRTVRLEFDRERRDRYDRLLAYVFLDTLMVNAELIRQGYGHAYTKYPFRQDYMDAFRGLEREARAHRRGLWGSPPPATCAALAAAFARIAAEPDAGRRTAAVDTLWTDLRRDGRIPFVAGDSVVFLFRGAASSVAFPGDANGWDPAKARAVRVPGTEVWARIEPFPRDARLDYKIVTNGGTWLMDPANPHRQRGGFGDNSELRMPAWTPSPWTVRREGVPRGTLIPATIRSEALGCAIAYQVYAPAGYETMNDLPVIYVTDGHEYADPAMGAMVEVLDNLIATGRLRPVAAVFIDPRVDGVNRRGEQYVLNRDFVRFVARELVPAIDAHGRTSRDRRDRAILGTSLGGLNSAWFVVQAPDVFGRIGIMSPAFHAGDGKILDHWRRAARLDVDIVMTWGTFNDFGEHTRRFQAILDDKGYAYRAIVTHEGHSWGQWRALLDDILTAFWPAQAP